MYFAKNVALTLAAMSALLTQVPFSGTAYGAPSAPELMISPVYEYAIRFSADSQTEAVRTLQDSIDSQQMTPEYSPSMAEATVGVACAVTSTVCTNLGCTNDSLCGITQGSWDACDVSTDVVGCTIHAECTDGTSCTGTSDCTEELSCTQGDN